MLPVRYCSTIRIGGTKSTRIAAGQLFGEFGGNITNPDKNLLTIYAAQHGYSFVQPDQSGAEALVVAYETEAGNFRALFQHGVKPHTWMAMHLFPDRWTEMQRPAQYYLDAPISEIKTTPNWKAIAQEIGNSGEPYDIGKRVIHASNYKMGPRTFMMNVLKQSFGQLVLSYEECKTYLNKYKILFPEVVDWHVLIERYIRDYRRLTNLLGISRDFHRTITDSYIRDAISWIPQSTVGGITNDACIEIQDLCETTHRAWNLLSNKHDSHMTEVPDTEVEEAVPVLQRTMEVELTSTRGEKYRMRTGCAVGKNWGKWHAKKNPLGMKERE